MEGGGVLATFSTPEGRHEEYDVRRKSATGRLYGRSFLHVKGVEFYITATAGHCGSEKQTSLVRAHNEASPQLVYTGRTTDKSCTDP